ncbi:MAG: hypothetical protein A2033_04235 [Bacteroidetes bacterium GWA2_31_9]|nr:MAG: hypothetical protein A2033_04235 [Bacteroidetes bacterium GWA2_31_9]
MDLKTQEEVFRNLKSFYPKDTKFVVLSMDMEHMAAGNPKISFEKQLEDLADLKKKYGNIIFPFVCADPRNLSLTQTVKKYITQHHFQGIKLYPALGFYPFDIRLHEVYKFAIENNIPIITHCCKGVIYNRAEIKEVERIHPITGERFDEKAKRDFTTHYTDPKNFDYSQNDTTEDNNKRKKLAERILFGTDFFLVEQKDTERNLTIELRAFLGYENFRQISD